MIATIFRPRNVALLIVGLALSGGIGWLWWPRLTPQEQYQRGLIAVERNDWQEVLRSADRLKEQTEFASKSRLLRGIYCLKTNQPTTAFKQFRLLDPVGDIREPALLYTGEALYRLDRLPEAAQMFATLAFEQPGQVDSHRWLAAIAYDFGDYNRAMDELGIVIRLAPSDYRPHILIGQMKFDLEQFQSSIEDYLQAIAKNPPSGVLEEVLPSLARAQMHNRDYSAALETLAHVSRSAKNLALQAECELSFGNESVVRKLIADAEKMDPKQPDMLRLLGRLELDSGHYEAAAVSLHTVLELDPQDHATRHQLAQALRLLGRSAEADAEASRSAHTLELKERLSKLTQDSIARPNDAVVREQMAELCDQLGKTELAASWRRAASACRQMQTRPDGRAKSH